MVGELGQENHAVYVATKGAVIALTKAMALDYAPFGIRVNAICPAAVWTPLLREWVQEQANPAGTEDFLNHIHALGYCPDGDVVADVAVFLLVRSSSLYDRRRAARQRRRRAWLSPSGPVNAKEQPLVLRRDHTCQHAGCPFSAQAGRRRRRHSHQPPVRLRRRPPAHRWAAHRRRPGADAWPRHGHGLQGDRNAGRATGRPRDRGADGRLWPRLSPDRRPPAAALAGPAQGCRPPGAGLHHQRLFRPLGQGPRCAAVAAADRPHARGSRGPARPQLPGRRAAARRGRRAAPA